MRSISGVITLIISLALAIASAGCAAGRPWQGTVKAGLVLPFSGYDTATAYNALLAAKLALREWNARGGVAGYRVELVALDDENDTEVAARRAKELAADPDIIGAIGHLSTDAALGAIGEYRQAQMPLLTFATGLEATRAGNLGIFRLAPDDERLADAALNALSAKSPIGRMAIVDDGTRGHRALAAALADEVSRRSGSTVVRESIEPAQRNFADIAERSRKLEAQALFFAGGFQQAAALYEQLRSQAPSVRFLASEDSDTPDFAKTGGPSLRGAMYLSAVPAPGLTNEAGSASRETAGFVGKYVSFAGMQPLRHAPIVYDAVNILLLAAERDALAGRKPTRQDVSSGIGQVSFPGASGLVKPGEDGELISFAPQVYTIDESGYPGLSIR